MPGLREHRVWVITYTVEAENREPFVASVDGETYGTGVWSTFELSLMLVAPDNRQLVLAWFEQYTRHHVGRNKKVTSCEPHMLTAFIQDHQY